MRCSTCGGVAHPATGCQYSQNFIVCGPCTREAWQWLRQFTASKGRRRGPSFYDHVNKLSAPITVSGPEDLAGANLNGVDLCNANLDGTKGYTP